MHKRALLVGVDDFLCDNFLKFIDKKVLCLGNNLLYLEKIKTSYNVDIYPLTLFENEVLKFKAIFDSRFFRVKEIIFNVNYFFNSKPIKYVDFDEFCLFFDFNFKFFFLLIKSLLFIDKSDSVFLTFLINKKNTDKSVFLYQDVCINSLLINFMKELNKEFFSQNIYLNCISLENINLSYRKNIYPYRLYSFRDLTLSRAYEFILKKRLKNKIIVP